MAIMQHTASSLELCY